MGVNAQTTVPTFTAAQVLTADQMNQSARTGVPVFADTTARDAAFGGSGEKTLAEGQLCYVENLTGVAQIQYYDGSNWVSLAAGGLVPITTSSFTSVTSVSVNNCFTSTYQNYAIMAVTGDPATAQTFTMRLRAGGTDTTTNNYYRLNIGIENNSTQRDVVGQSSSFFMGFVGAGSEFAASFDVFSPEEARLTRIAGSSVNNNLNHTGVTAYNLGGWFDLTTQFDGFSLIFGANTTGVVRVYAYANS